MGVPVKNLVMVQRWIPWKCFDDTSCFVASRGLSWVECKPRGCREHNPITCNLLPLYRCLSQLTRCASKNAPLVITYLRSPAQNDSTSFHANHQVWIRVSESAFPWTSLQSLVLQLGKTDCWAEHALRSGQGAKMTNSQLPEESRFLPTTSNWPWQ